MAEALHILNVLHAVLLLAIFGGVCVLIFLASRVRNGLPLESVSREPEAVVMTDAQVFLSPQVEPAKPAGAVRYVTVRYQDTQGRVLAEEMVDARSRRPELRRTMGGQHRTFSALSVERGVWVYREIERERAS